MLTIILLLKSKDKIQWDGIEGDVSGSPPPSLADTFAHTANVDYAVAVSPSSSGSVASTSSAWSAARSALALICSHRLTYGLPVVGSTSVPAVANARSFIALNFSRCLA